MKQSNPESGQQKPPSLRTPNRIALARSRVALNTPSSSGHSYAFMPFPESPNNESRASDLGSTSALINQSKKEAFLRGNIAVKLPAWMQKADLLPISAYSPKRNHRKSLTYGTPETGSSSGSASCGKAADGGRIFTPGSLSKRQLVPISPRGSNKRLQEMSSDAAPNQSQESTQEFDRSKLPPKVMKSKPSYESPIADRNNPHRVNGMQVHLTPPNEKAAKPRHMKTPVVPEGIMRSQTANKAPVVTEPLGTDKETREIARLPGVIRVANEPMETDGEETAMVQSSAEVAGPRDRGNSVMHKDRIVIVIDDDDDDDDVDDGSDRIEEDQSESESGHAVENFDDNIKSKNWGRCGTNVGSNHPGDKSITGKDLPDMTQRRGSRVPERDMVWKPSGSLKIEGGVDDRRERHAGTGGSARCETRLSSSQTQAEAENNAAGLEAVAGLGPRAGTPIESSRLSTREMNHPPITQQTAPIKQPIIIIIPDDEDEDEGGGDKNGNGGQDEDHDGEDEDGGVRVVGEDDDTGSEYYGEIASPPGLLKPIQLDDEGRVSSSSVTSSEPAIISAKSSPRKRIKLSQFARPALSPTPMPGPDRSRWSSPYKSVHRRFSGPMIITPLRRTPVPAGLGVVDESHYPFPDFGSFPKANPVVEAPPGKRQRRYVGPTGK